MPPTSQFFQVPASGELGEIGACEGTQAVLAIRYTDFFGKY